MDRVIPTKPRREPWNKGKLVGQKAPLCRERDQWAHPAAMCLVRAIEPKHTLWPLSFGPWMR